MHAENENTDLYQALGKASHLGVPLFVDGQEVLSKEAAIRCVQEKCDYMADYVLGADGRLEQIRLDKVSLRKE